MGIRLEDVSTIAIVEDLTGGACQKKRKKPGLRNGIRVRESSIITESGLLDGRCDGDIRSALVPIHHAFLVATVLAIGPERARKTFPRTIDDLRRNLGDRVGHRERTGHEPAAADSIPVRM